MNEQEFREFLRQNARNLSPAEIENIVARSSPEHFLAEAAKQGENISEARANAVAALLRKQVVTNIAMYRNGTASKDDVLNFRIDKFPDDFPS